MQGTAEVQTPNFEALHNRQLPEDTGAPSLLTENLRPRRQSAIHFLIDDAATKDSNLDSSGLLFFESTAFYESRQHSSTGSYCPFWWPLRPETTAGLSGKIRPWQNLGHSGLLTRSWLGADRVHPGPNSPLLTAPLGGWILFYAYSLPHALSPNPPSSRYQKFPRN